MNGTSKFPRGKNDRSFALRTASLTKKCTNMDIVAQESKEQTCLTCCNNDERGYFLRGTFVLPFTCETLLKTGFTTSNFLLISSSSPSHPRCLSIMSHRLSSRLQFILLSTVIQEKMHWIWDKACHSLYSINYFDSFLALGKYRHLTAETQNQ